MKHEYLSTPRIPTEAERYLAASPLAQLFALLLKRAAAQAPARMRKPAQPIRLAPHC